MADGRRQTFCPLLPTAYSPLTCYPEINVTAHPSFLSPSGAGMTGEQLQINTVSYY